MTEPKKMSREDQRNLFKLIESDYSILRGDFQVQVTQAREEEMEDTRLQFGDRTQDKIEAARKIRALEEETRRKYEDLLSEFRKDGLVLSTKNSAYNQPPTPTIQLPAQFTVSGRKEALDKVTSKWNEISRKGHNSLVQQESQTKRELILGNMSPEAKDVLDGLPKVEEIVAKAAQAFEQNAAQIEQPKK